MFSFGIAIARDVLMAEGLLFREINNIMTISYLSMKHPFDGILIRTHDL